MRYVLDVGLGFGGPHDDSFEMDQRGVTRRAVRIIKFMLKHGDPNQMYGCWDEVYGLTSPLMTPFEKFKEMVDSISEFDDQNVAEFEVDDGDIHGIIILDDGNSDHLEDMTEENKVKIDNPLDFFRKIMIPDEDEDE